MLNYWDPGEKKNQSERIAGDLLAALTRAREIDDALVEWGMPMGPLRLSYGKPIRKQPTDRIEKFQFQIGTAF